MIEEKLFLDAKKCALNSIPSLFQKSFQTSNFYQLSAQSSLVKEKKIFLLLSGFLIEEDKNKNCIRFMQNGDLLFVEQILSNSLSANNYVALTDCVFLQIDLEQIQAEVKSNPLYHLDILNVVTKSLQVMDELSVNKITLPLKYQLVKLIQLLHKQITFHNYPIIPVGKNLIQNYLSCSSSNLNRLLSELEEQKMIQFVGKGFCVKNTKLLEKVLA
jgi:CRP-like cAMP-binding protein